MKCTNANSVVNAIDIANVQRQGGGKTMKDLEMLEQQLTLHRNHHYHGHLASSEQAHLIEQPPQPPPPLPSIPPGSASDLHQATIENGGGRGAGGAVGLSLGAGDDLCGSCGVAITLDRYIMKVNDSSYHERCLQCSVCSASLNNSCFMRDGKLFCRIDYER